ncbi:MAG: molybdopterin molybdotransferase [Chloroflexi bacterium]|nr:MAG: molybdopterin molybdotransferase [Chloroflexota bacterium]MBA4376693.1 molybdopterin biosynthesis protein [Anaerolinea sp.]
MTKSLFLHDIPLDRAVSEFQTALEKIGRYTLLGIEQIPLDEDAVGRVLGEPIFARHCSPHYHASAMDGFAVRSVETIGANPSMPLILRAIVQAEYVDTGDALPAWSDAVIPIENTESLDIIGNVLLGEMIRKPSFIRIRASVTPWSHVRPVGEDLITGQLILAASQILRPADLGAGAAGGVKTLRVAKKPVIGIIPTGNELVPLEREPKTGEITEFNSIVLASQIKEWGGIPIRYKIVKDDLNALCAQIKKAAAECDLVLVNAGSSAGSDDYTSTAVQKLGQVLVHGIAVRPGHPVILGAIHHPVDPDAADIPFIGVPGYPVSAAMTTEIFVKPLVRIWLGLPPENIEEVDAVFTRKITSPGGDDDFVRVVLGEVNGKMLAAPISRGAGVTTSLAKADGFLIIPRMIQGVENGEKVKIRLYRKHTEIKNNLLTIGSHDLTLDILAQHLIPFGRRLVSANAGSMGGLLAIKRKETHFSGCHLLDPDTGTYNIVDLQKVIPEVSVCVMGWVNREQGLIVAKGNPKHIKGLEDLRREDLTYINRQRGSGTRVLLDYHLQKIGLDIKSIMGYSEEEYTHLGVAVAVSSGRANCGLAVASAAAALDLDFIPLYEEEYQLIIPEELIHEPILKPLFELSFDPAFKADIMKLPGYNLMHMGEITTISAGTRFVR